MKSIITNLFFLFFVFGSVNHTFSQTEAQRRVLTKDYDQVTLTKLAERLEAEYKENYNKALILAKQNNWPLRIQKADGGSSELQGVSDNGTPLYYTTSNLGSSITSRTNQVQPNGVLGLNLTGFEMNAGVWEDNKPIDHDDFKGRFVNPDGTNGANSVGFHATHVIGTVISNGNSNALGKGMATEAYVWNYNWANDLAEMAQAAKAGLVVSNHSYGLIADELDESYFGAYMKTTKDLDAVMFNAPRYQAVIAAGNDRDGGVNSTKNGYDLLTKYCTAKNAVVVAAVSQVLDYTGPQSVTMSSFSNWGPTDDNRIKPDISTKGVAVYSTSDNPSKKGYANSQGTSMAAPGITGSLLLLQQHFYNLYGDFMYSSTLRGLMSHTASEAGSYPGPDAKFGWGLMNTGEAAQIITKSAAGNEQVFLSELTLNQGATYTKNITISGSEPLMATIAWTDAPGTSTSGVVDSTVPVLVNDLDIRITKDNTTYFPWKLGLAPKDPAIKGDNIVDNIEKIEILEPGAGTYTITVSHKGTLDAGKQKYSLIVTGSTTLSTNDTVFEKFDVWPNPINDQLNVAIQSQSSDDVFVTVYDILGKRIINEKLNFSNDFYKGTLNVESINPGIYLVKITQGNKQSVRKIVKK